MQLIDGEAVELGTRPVVSCSRLPDQDCLRGLKIIQVPPEERDGKRA
jgi:hypothetical protein